MALRNEFDNSSGKTTAGVLNELLAAADMGQASTSVSKVTEALENTDVSFYGFKHDALKAVNDLAVGDNVPTKHLVQTLAYVGERAGLTADGSTYKSVGIGQEDLSLAAKVLQRYGIDDPNGVRATGLANSASLIADGENRLNAAKNAAEIGQGRLVPQQAAQLKQTPPTN